MNAMTNARTARWMISCFLIAITGVQCGRRPAFTTESLSAFLDRREKIYEQLSIQEGEAAWQRVLSARPSERSENNFIPLFTEDSLNTVVTEWAGRLHEIKNDTLRRRVEIWSHMLKAARVNLNPEVSTLEHQIKQWMETDEARRSVSADSMETLTLALIQHRNRLARMQGYAHYAEMVLDVSGVDTVWYRNLIETIDQETRPIYSQALARRRDETQGVALNMADIRSIFIGYYMSRQGPQVDHAASLALMENTVRDIGFDWSALPVQFVEKELPGLLVGEGTTVRIPGDFRAVLTPNLGFKNRLHELGHGLQLLFTEIQSPVLKGYYWNMGGDNAGWSEAMADVIARFSEHPAWMEKHAAAKPPAADRVGLAAYLRFQLVTLMFEWELYKDPTQDLAQLNRRLMKRFLMIDAADARPPALASAIFVSYPMYLYAYTVSEMVSWQVHATLEEAFGPRYVFDSRVADFLKRRLYSSGELYSWQERLKRATGRCMDVSGYLKAHGF